VGGGAKIVFTRLNSINRAIADCLCNCLKYRLRAVGDFFLHLWRRQNKSCSAIFILHQEKVGGAGRFVRQAAEKERAAPA